MGAEETVYQQLDPALTTEFDGYDKLEADGKIMFTDLILLYIDCKLQIIESNSWASENIQRENLTNESLRKIDEIEEEKLKIKRKEKRAADFKKQLANYRKES